MLLNERLRDALRDAVGRLEPRAERARRRASAADGPGFRHQPSAYEAPAPATSRDPGAARGALRAGRAVRSRYGSRDELLAALDRIEGQLTGTLHAAAAARTSRRSSTRSRRAPAA